MLPANLARRAFLRSLALGTGALATAPLWADAVFAEEGTGLREPVLRVAKAETGGSIPAGSHPLDPGLKMAHDALTVMQRDIVDYTATLVKRERVNGEVGGYQFMFAKIRNRKMNGDNMVTPLSVYLNFLKPDNVKGREVVWVEGQNNNKLRAHEGGGLGSKFLPSVWLDPDGALAMRGNLHPIYDVGIENLVVKLIEKGQTVRALGPENCEVTFTKGAKIKGSKDDVRTCTVLNVRHPEQREPYEFHLAQVFIDDELQVPIRYVAYHWPTAAGDTTGPVIEEYTYLNLKLNVGLTDADFDSNNPNYNF
jgi:hypothetical protein